MHSGSKLITLATAAAIVLSACASSATPAPTSAPAGAALKGALTVWHSYGSGAGTEATALKTVTDKIKAANPT